MEIFMHNIPIRFHEEHTLKVILARHLHGPDFPHIKANFQLDLFWPKKGKTTGTGTLTLADLFIAERFLEIHGGQHPRKIIEIGGNQVYFQKSFRKLQPDVLELLSRSRWVDPATELEQQKRFQRLSSSRLPVKAIQFGWTCRDRVFSIEGEERKRRCDLTFDPERGEIHLIFPRENPQPNTHVIAIRYTSILSASAHTLGRDSVVHFQLETPPQFLRRKRDDKPFYRASVLPFQSLNPLSTPYISFAIRVVFAWNDSITAFNDLAKTAGLHHIQSFQVPIVRRHLFAAAHLDRLEEQFRALEWHVAFQLEALLRNLDIDARELLGILPRVQELVEKHGGRYVGDLLRRFARQVRNLSCSDGRNTINSVLNCLNESHQQFMEQTTPDSPSEETLYHSFHLTVTPTTMFLTGPFLEKSNRVIRRYQQVNQESFLRVEFREEDGLKYRFDHGVNGRAFIQDRMGPILKEGVVVAGQKFEFLAYSQSALREHSVWFCRPFIDEELGEVNAAKIIQSLGTFDNLPYDPELMQCPARYAARLSLAFTTTEAATVKVKDEDIIDIKDVKTRSKRKNQYIFTDGSGNMSEDLAREIWRAIGPKGGVSDDFPHAYQIRLGGSKGMLSIDYRLNGSNKLNIRPSMVKFEVPQTKDATTEIEIARAIIGPTPYHLNRPLIMLLEGLGIRVEEIQRFQDQAVAQTQDATRSPRDAARLLETHGLGSSFRLAATLQKLAELGIENLQGDPFYDQLLQISVYHVLRDLKNNARIPIPNSWTLVGVADTHGFLEENEIFACVKQPNGEIVYLEGQVLISRSPCIHPGDVRAAIAIGCPKESPFVKEPLPNTVVFSVKGKRPLPSCLGGGDLDGDVYNLLPLTIHKALTPLRYFDPADYGVAERKKLDRPSTMEDVADFVMEYITSDVIGLVASHWLVIADQSQFGIHNQACLRLAKLHSDAVDYPKTGNPVNVADIPKLKYPKPDWSAPETVDPDPVNYYQSQSAIGILSRAIKLEEHEPSLPSSPVDNLNAVQLVGDGGFLKKVKQRISRYIKVDEIQPNREIENILSWFSDELLQVASECSLSNRHSKPLHEAEVIVGTITQKTPQPRMRKDNISKMRELTDSLIRRVRWWLEGDNNKPSVDYLRDAWLAWSLSFETARKERFGVRAFGWVALGGILDALQILEESK